MSEFNAVNRGVYISDNLPFLRSLNDECIDLVCIDPPFAKNETFTGDSLKPPLTEEEREIEWRLLDRWQIRNEATAVAAGVTWPMHDGGYKDIWSWENDIHEEWLQTLDQSWSGIAKLIDATRYVHGDSIAAYLCYMAVRIIEIHRVLKPTGSLYLHCDHTADGYLRQLLDGIFGKDNFRNAITWQRTSTRKGNVTRGLANDADTILRYSKSENFIWNKEAIIVPYDKDNLDPKTSAKYSKKDRDGRLYRLASLDAPKQNPASANYYELMGFTRTWRWNRKRMKQAIASGRVVQTAPGRVPQQVLYLDEQQGKPLNNVWTDIYALNSQAIERTGYPTQKPVALAERIIASSSHPGNIVLDCFAGCAYVAIAAERLHRRWVACDLNPRAWTVFKRQFNKPLLGCVDSLANSTWGQLSSHQMAI